MSNDLDFWGFPSRTVCQCLTEMRDLYKTCNFGALPGLIEEVQMLANRMEAQLDTQYSYAELRDKIRKGKEELKQIKNEVNLTKEIKELKK